MKFYNKIFKKIKKILKSEKSYDYYFKRYRYFPRFVEQKLKFFDYDLVIPDAVSFAYQVKEIFQDEHYKFKSSTEEPIIIDCGANIGLSILFFKKLYPNSKVYAFEADPKIFGYLKQNLESNSIKDVNIFNKAVWKSNGKILFASEGADGGSIYQDFDKKFYVDSVRLKDFISQFEIIDFLKMDIEGAEFDVIMDLNESLSKKIKYLCFEYHSFINREQKLGELLEILRKNQFRYYIKTLNLDESPFIEKDKWNNMDLQLEIYAKNISNLSN